jgi:tagaturonate reductase
MQTTMVRQLNRKNFNLQVYPERVIQFGTGVLLRGLVGFAINKANAKGEFNGSIVQIKSTGNGSADEFDQQDQLYTVALRGMKNGELMQWYELNSSINRTLNANTEWLNVLQLAQQAETNIIVSNTTEAGIVYDERDTQLKIPPVSFPGKLLALLHERFTVFNGDKSKGYIIIPTELISNNADELKAIVLRLANIRFADDVFINWIHTANTFCNSLVDRIVTGKPLPEKLAAHEQELQYKDKLLIECEPYLLWAIQGDEPIGKALSFAMPGSGVVVATAIEKYKELKLRLLNGTHTFICGMAFVNGFEYVKDAMQNTAMRQEIRQLLMQELALSLSYETQEATVFAETVLERFANPFIDHKWINISLNYTQKMGFRNVANIKRYYSKFGSVPQQMAKGFAYYIRFMMVYKTDEHQVLYGKVADKYYVINDPEAAAFYALQQQYQGAALVAAVLGKLEWWMMDLNMLPGFAAAVSSALEKITK